MLQVAVAVNFKDIMFSGMYFFYRELGPLFGTPVARFICLCKSYPTMA
jgi:hypothetical protein